ncbi:MAG: rod shape-determining protein MreC [Defluviitaleaceae bacterium]|nr:rod shape-determining protein MreC [Defluviitaleaceae bacterium]
MELLYRYKRIFLAIGMIICVLAMIITLNENYRPSVVVRSLSQAIVPLQSATTTATRWVSSRVSFLWEMSHIQQENANLRNQIGWLEIENQRLQLAGEENQRLSELLYLRQQYAQLPIIGARIIAHDPNDWYRSFKIDRGTNDGLAVNMAVLGNGGLIGRIESVQPTSATVISILDDRFVVSVQSVRTDDQWIVKGDSRLMQDGLVRMDYIDPHAQIMAGDEVLTAIQGSIFPPAVRVGVVMSVQPTPNGLAQYATVRPFGNVRRLDEVLVVNQLFGPDDWETEELEAE